MAFNELISRARTVKTLISVFVYKNGRVTGVVVTAALVAGMLAA